MLTATLVAGVGVVGLSAVATAGQAQAAAAGPAQAAAGQTPAAAERGETTRQHPALAAPAFPDGAGESGTVEAVLIPPVAPTGRGELSWVAPTRATRPVPPELAQWVNPLPEAVVTSCFGQRWGRLHAGVDLAAPNGTRIRAAGAGVVLAAGAAAGYGNAVLIDHGNGFLTHYGHMSVVAVRVGQHVAVGELLGNEGSTGHSTGPHLHFEVHQGSYKNPIEPTRWMHEHGIDISGCTTSTDVAG
jgi:murein DD-endopeptidase MepM/ murein hydrolase activator NlpD